MKEISYKTVRSSRKTISIQIQPSGEVVVRCPRRMPEGAVRSFVQSKTDWIRMHLEKLSQVPVQPPLSQEALRDLAQKAAQMIPERAAYYASLMGVTYGKITVRCQRTRWGSCSGKGNLSFNCLLMLTPPEVIDYVVVHELSHRKEMNHSAAFWKEVERILPDYRDRRKWLKENGTALMGRLPQ